MLKPLVFFHLSLLVACGRPAENLDEREKNLQTTGVAFELAGLSFLSEPGKCEGVFSKTYYCDGYTQRNLPVAPTGANETTASRASKVSRPGFVGIEEITSFDSKKPTLLYIHGWNVEGENKVFGFPDAWAHQAQAAGYNVMQFHWASLSYDSGEGCPGFQWFGFGNIPCNSSFDIYTKGGSSDKFIEAYKGKFTGYSQSVRLVAQSLGASLAITSLYRMYLDPSNEGLALPSRLDLIDPFIMPGMGASRTRPYDGQMPEDSLLPSDLRSSLVTSFRPSSACRSTWWLFFPANHLSQYCQNEGMLYKLVSENDLAVLNLSSIVSWATAHDFRYVVVDQAFSAKAFKGDLLARHVTPNAAYFYSLAPGEPKRGYDASSSDEKVLSASLSQLRGENVAVIQTAGFDTVKLSDDAYQRRP